MEILVPIAIVTQELSVFSTELAGKNYEMFILLLKMQPLKYKLLPALVKAKHLDLVKNYKNMNMTAEIWLHSFPSFSILNKAHSM